jgi:signal transduction histidine kinase
MRFPIRTNAGGSRALEELDRARTELFQNITHELRAPLTMLLTPLQDILQEPGVVLSAAARDTVETSVRAGDRLQKVVDATARALACGIWSTDCGSRRD